MILVFVFFFKLKIPFLGYFAPNNQNCLFKFPGSFEYAKIDGDVHFFFFKPEILFWGKFGQENQNCLFKLKFGN